MTLLHNKEFGGRKLRCFYSEPKDPSTIEAKSTVSTLSVRLDGHQGYIDAQAVEDFFSQFGEVASVMTPKGESDSMLVEYYRISDSQRALKARGMPFLDGVWNVSLASPRKSDVPPPLDASLPRKSSYQRDSFLDHRAHQRQRSPEYDHGDSRSKRSRSRSPRGYRESPYPDSVPRYANDRYDREPPRDDFYENSHGYFRDRDRDRNYDTRYERHEYGREPLYYDRNAYEDHSNTYPYTEYPERESRYDRPSDYPSVSYYNSEPRYSSSEYYPVNEPEYSEPRFPSAPSRDAGTHRSRPEHAGNVSEERAYVPRPYLPLPRTDPYLSH